MAFQEVVPFHVMAKQRNTLLQSVYLPQRYTVLLLCKIETHNFRFSPHFKN